MTSPHLGERRESSIILPVVSEALYVSYFLPDDRLFAVTHLDKEHEYCQLAAFKTEDKSTPMLSPLMAHLKECEYPWPPAPFLYLGKSRRVVLNSPKMYDERGVFTGINLNPITMGKLFERNHHLALYTFEELALLAQAREMDPLSFQAVLHHHKILTQAGFASSGAPFNITTQVTNDAVTSKYLSQNSWTPKL